AWIMGNRDLAEMDSGRMDPSGRDTTNIGRILGIISVCLAVVGFIVWGIIMVAAVGSAGVQGM
ncbi:MAG: hypothetical protein ACE5R4_06940, partial [Armatimonadota bacterium]